MEHVIFIGILSRFLASENWAVCMILHLTVLAQCQLVTDRRADGQTHDNSKYHTSVALLE